MNVYASFMIVSIMICVFGRRSFSFIFFIRRVLFVESACGDESFLTRAIPDETYFFLYFIKYYLNLYMIRFQYNLLIISLETTMILLLTCVSKILWYAQEMYLSIITSSTYNYKSVLFTTHV